MLRYRETHLALLLLLAAVLCGCTDFDDPCVKMWRQEFEAWEASRQPATTGSNIVIRFDDLGPVSIDRPASLSEGRVVSILEHAVGLMVPPPLPTDELLPNEHSVLKTEQPVGSEEKPCEKP